MICIYIANLCSGVLKFGVSVSCKVRTEIRRRRYSRQWWKRQNGVVGGEKKVWDGGWLSHAEIQHYSIPRCWWCWCATAVAGIVLCLFFHGALPPILPFLASLFFFSLSLGHAHRRTARLRTRCGMCSCYKRCHFCSCINCAMCWRKSVTSRDNISSLREKWGHLLCVSSYANQNGYTISSKTKRLRSWVWFMTHFPIFLLNGKGELQGIRFKKPQQCTLGWRACLVGIQGPNLEVEMWSEPTNTQDIGVFCLGDNNFFEMSWCSVFLTTRLCFCLCWCFVSFWIYPYGHTP